MKKYLMLGIVLLAVVGMTLGAVSAEEWSFNWGSSSSSNSDGGAVDFTNGVLKLQDLQFKIPEGFEQNESAQKLATDADGIDGAKASVTQFVKDGKEIFVKVFFFTDDNKFTAPTAEDGDVNKTIADNAGLFNDKKYSDDGSVVFRYVKDGKLVEIIAPDEATLESVIK